MAEADLAEPRTAPSRVGHPGPVTVEPEERRFTTDLLVALILDDLAPAVEAHRRAVARRLGLEPVDLLCLDVVRRLDEGTPSSALVTWTGLSRSALSKALRRLELAGHVARRTDELGNGEILVTVVAHEERDRLLAGLRPGPPGGRRARRRPRADPPRAAGGARRVPAHDDRDLLPARRRDRGARGAPPGATRARPPRGPAQVALRTSARSKRTGRSSWA